jgi:hypothetical protein
MPPFPNCQLWMRFPISNLALPSSVKPAFFLVTVMTAASQAGMMGTCSEYRDRLHPDG